MGIEYTRLGWALFAVASLSISSAVQAADDVGRQIEEVIVTAERKASAIQDTSISITAFTTEMLDDFGIRNQSDLQNMVPATTIQPYDSAIRGVGRNFRNLGGDPGVATYLNGVYFEDLYSVTIGSFWDMERIEVLRGPQGTLYGRNAVGGAMNFHYKKPTDEVEFSAKTILGDFGTNDFYAVLSGPLIKDTLNGRITASSRQHDGWIEDHGLGPDLDSGDEQNVAIQLEWTINDNMHLHLRSNQANVDRVMGGADGAGLIVLTGENTTPGGDHLRDYTHDRLTVRAVDPGVVDPLNEAFVDPTQAVLTYTNPTTGAPILAQYDRPGIDYASERPNFGLGSTLDPSECVFLDRDDIDGDDLCAFTNGLNNETFIQQGNQLEFVWDINDGLVFKYIFGYNDLMYERDTDDDNTASTTIDRTFYVNHEATYASHELQLFWDVGDNLTFTSGVFSIQP
jgi:outer membrane receptor protein involved in Fe transport